MKIAQYFTIKGDKELADLVIKRTIQTQANWDTGLLWKFRYDLRKIGAKDVRVERMKYARGGDLLPLQKKAEDSYRRFIKQQ